MEKKTYTLNTVLAILLSAVLLICCIIRAFFPRIILLQADIPNLVLLSLVALLIDHYAAPGAKRCYICIPVFSAVSFGLLPWAAAFVTPLEALMLAVTGCVTFSLVSWLFSSMMDRLSSGPAAKAAPFLSAAGLYLASQALMGMF